MNHHVDRRTFLKGVGVSLALPALESVGLTARPSRPVKRMVCVGNPFGFEPDFYRPRTAGEDYETTEYLKALQPFRRDLTLFSNFDHSLARGGHNGVDTYLSGIPASEASKFPQGNISVDQKAAEFVGTQTRFPSIQGYVEGQLIKGKPGNFSFGGNGLPRPQFRAAELFDKLLRTKSAQERRATRESLSARTSILDVVGKRAHELQRRVSKGDRARIEEYLTSVRALEKDLAARGEWLDRPMPETDYRFNADAPMLRSLYDVIFLALQTDSTRVATITITPYYHSATHHGNLPEKVAQLHAIEQMQFEEYAKFLEKLKQTDDPLTGGKMLDHTTVLFGAGMSDGASHSLKNLPLSVAGGQFRHGRHVAAERRTEACNIYLSMLQEFGLEIDRFGLSSGTAAGFERKAG